MIEKNGAGFRPEIEDIPNQFYEDIEDYSRSIRESIPRKSRLNYTDLALSLLVIVLGVMFLWAISNNGSINFN